MTELIINEDNQSFYNSRPESEMTAEGVDAVVDAAARYPVTAIAFCINVQRALFASQAWETFYSDYDPEAGLEQPTEWRQHGGRNLWLLEQRGIDHHARWLARCRHHGIEGWISMRMNDCHGLKEFVEGENGVADTHWTRHWPSTFWCEHLELRRAPYRMERSWEGAFDYSHQAVRDHHMALVREALERWDMDGFELDWLRWGMMFAPGKEQAGLPILTEFIREVRRLADASATRLGHPVKLSVRVPAEPASCLALGFDVPRWAEEGLVDTVILSSFLGAANFDYPISIWRRLLGADIKLITNAEQIVSGHPTPSSFAQGIVGTGAFTFGAAASALHRGADGIHLFNHCPSKLLAGPPVDPYLDACYRDLVDLPAILRRPRRNAITFPHVCAPGEPNRAILPIPLTVPGIGIAFGRMEENITLRIPIGPKPTDGTASLQLGFSDITPPLDPFELRINQQLCAPTDQRPHPFAAPPDDVLRTFIHGHPPKEAAQLLLYHVPLTALQDDINVVEFLPPQVPGHLVWAELLIVPEPS